MPVETNKETLWSRLGSGKLPSMDINTGVEVKSSSLVSIGAMLFISFCLILLAFYAFKKVAK
ncbi:MAG: hypothetical protein M1445_01180 [Bacteroidetes bacterium]|nr:hypothetical protein [Bacteroidota bacterium]